MPVIVIALALVTFAMGTTEFVIVGVLPEISHDLAVSSSTAGLLVTAYALAVAVGTPIVSAATARVDRRTMMLVLMGAFIVANIGAALAPNFALLMTARVLMAVAQGVSFAIATNIVASSVPREKVGSAISTMLLGLTLALVAGVPFGSWLGNATTWRMPFFVVAGLGLLSLAVLAAFMPRNLEFARPPNLLAQVSALRHRRLMALYGVTILGVGGCFVTFTYLSPLLTRYSDISVTEVSIALVVFGVGTVLGTQVAGRMIDRFGVRTALVVMLAGQAAALLVLLASVHNTITAFVNVGIWGAFAFALPPIISSGAVTIAEDEAPESAGTASSLSISAMNLGISGGSLLAALVVSPLGLLSLPWVGALAVGAGVALALGSVRGRPRLTAAAEQDTKESAVVSG
jgi:DHA1 family inner membrane transport protein